MSFKPAVNVISAWAIACLSTLASAQSQSVTLVSGNDYPPFTGSVLAHGGVLTQLVRQAFAAGDKSSSVDFKPWARGYEETLRLEYDATFPYLSTPLRTASFLFSEPLYQLNLRLYVRSDSPWKIGTQEELSRAIFCLPAGYEVSGWVYRETERLNFVRPRSMEQCHAMLQLGRVDVLISNPDELAWQAVPPLLTPRNVRKLPEPLDNVTLHMIIPRNHPQGQQLMDAFNSGLQQLIESGARDRLFQANPDYQRSLGVER
ncbi:ABC transporter substrate-binding protein [uncultured Halopseudomonas sp.]|uniref:substrate-binding periplasmic protein n=1 Tax=uncultured Halopseudomonas sp. TaxID=2901193 RepID=UPI0030EB4BC9|tara:strand:- start:46137 stop:46916 length:780 start_codon:yes stop_codon:yes gene_type:complete